MRVGMTQPWPPWTQTVEAVDIFASRSASSSTMSADLPPSSRNRRVMVALPFSTMRLPVALPLERIDGLRGPEQTVGERRVELRAVREHEGRADLGDEFRAQLLLLAHDRLVQLLEAALAERAVGGPVGLVERPPGGGDGALHVVDGRVGDFAQHLLGGRVDVLEALAGGGFHQLAVDEHA